MTTTKAPHTSPKTEPRNGARLGTRILMTSLCKGYMGNPLDISWRGPPGPPSDQLEGSTGSCDRGRLKLPQTAAEHVQRQNGAGMLTGANVRGERE